MSPASGFGMDSLAHLWSCACPRLLRGLEDVEKTDREEEEVLCRLVLCKRHFPLVTIVLCVHFIPHYCVDS